MTYEAQGIYMRILAYMWKDSKDQYSIPKNEIELSRMLGISKQKMKKNLAQIQKKDDSIFEETNTCYVSKRLREEVKKQKAFAEKKSEAGKKGMEKRWHGKDNRKDNSVITEGITEGITNDNSSSSSSSSSSPSTSKHKKIKHRHLDSVFLTKEEHQKLIEKFGKEKTQEWIENLDNYIGSKGKRYKSHYKTILVWAKRAGKSTGENSELQQQAIECAKDSRNFCPLSEQGIETKFCKLCSRYEERKEKYKHKYVPYVTGETLKKLLGIKEV